MPPKPQEMGLADAEDKETPTERARKSDRDEPGLIKRINAGLADWTIRAPVPMGIGTGIVAVVATNRVVDPAIDWAAYKIKLLGSSLTRGAAQQAAANLAKEAEHNLMSTRRATRALGQVFASRAAKETSKNALAGIIKVTGRNLGKVFR
jgi:hypothetical protein